MLERVVCANAVVVYRSPLLADAGVPHAFSSRLGGVSTGPFAAMNLGNPNGIAEQDDPANIAENYRRLHAAVGCEDRERAQVHQVHGCGVRAAVAGEAFDLHAKADAVVSGDPRRLASVRTADCTPVLVATRDGRRVAAVHAGWRGVIAGVVPETLRHFDDASDLLVAIGPNIQYDAFEVGPEVADAFDAAFGTANGKGVVTRRLPDGRARVDLARAIVLQLAAAGVTADRVDTTDRCTVTHADEFFSHRRTHGVTGRMAAVIGAVA